MNALFSLFIFCLVLFFYLHIQFQFKKSDDLEIYQLDNMATKDKLEELCDIRQPIIFDFDNYSIIEATNKNHIQTKYSSFDIKTRNSHDFYTHTEKEKEKEELYLPLQVCMAQKLFDEDKKSIYFTENNMDFLRKTEIVKSIQDNDAFIRPYMTSSSNYDILMGSEGAVTPLRYELNYRNFLIVTQGSVQVKLIPPKSIQHLYPTNDYENFEWSSPVNVWKVQPSFKSEFDKIKSLEFTMVQKTTLFIPAYWWYSIKFNKNSSITSLKYRTYMNDLAITPQFIIYILQNMNIKREPAKKINMDLFNKVEEGPKIEDLPGENLTEENLTGENEGTKIEDLPGKDLTGKDLPGKDLPGEDLPGKDLPGKDLPGENEETETKDLFIRTL